MNILSNTLLQQREATASWAALGSQQAEGGGPFPLFSTGETHLECCVHFQAPLYKTEMDMMERVQHSAMKIIKGLEHLSRGRDGEDGARLFSAVLSERTSTQIEVQDD